MLKKILNIFLLSLFTHCDSNLEREIIIRESISYIYSYAYHSAKIADSKDEESKNEEKTILKNEILKTLEYETDSEYIGRCFEKGHFMNQRDSRKICKEYGVNWFIMIGEISTYFPVFIILMKGLSAKWREGNENMKKILAPFKVLDDFISEDKDKFPNLDILMDLLVMGLKSISEYQLASTVTDNKDAIEKLLDNIPHKKFSLEPDSIEREINLMHHKYNFQEFSKREVLDLFGYTERSLNQKDIPICDIKNYLMLGLNTKKNFSDDEMEELKGVNLLKSDKNEEIIDKYEFYKFAAIIRNKIIQKVKEEFAAEKGASPDVQAIISYISYEINKDRFAKATQIDKDIIEDQNRLTASLLLL